jgi:16S rRNA (uracil1498-N3)-methyltransferase
MNRRVFTNESVGPGQVMNVTGEKGHHFARVLRLRDGEALVVAAANGPHAAVVTSVDAKRGEVTLQIGDPVERRDPAVPVYLVQSFAKGDKVDDVVEKCTELGVAGFCVLPTQRSIGQLTGERLTARLARWRRIAAEAAGQAQRDAVPSVDWYPGLSALDGYLEDVQPGLLLLLDEQETTCGIRTALKEALTQSAPLRSVVLMVGPEGGWDERERAWLRQAGAQSITIGQRILRTETAGLVAASAVLYEIGELGG